jgi:hypothetical protein
MASYRSGIGLLNASLVESALILKHPVSGARSMLGCQTDGNPTYAEGLLQENLQKEKVWQV